MNRSIAHRTSLPVVAITFATLWIAFLAIPVKTHADETTRRGGSVPVRAAAIESENQNTDLPSDPSSSTVCVPCQNKAAATSANEAEGTGSNGGSNGGSGGNGGNASPGGLIRAGSVVTNATALNAINTNIVRISLGAH